MMKNRYVYDNKIFLQTSKTDNNEQIKMDFAVKVKATGRVR